MTKQRCAAMQYDFSVPCMKQGKKVTEPLFLLGSQQPPVKTHDHHFSSLYRHNVLRPHHLTISYKLKFMSSSQCRNWFSTQWFPFSSEAYSDSYLWWQWQYDVLDLCTVQLHLMLWSQFWWCTKNRSSLFYVTINNRSQKYYRTYKMTTVLQVHFKMPQ